MIPPLIEFRNVTKVLGGMKVLDNVNFTLNKGENVAFLGYSGAGKSVLLKHIIGLFQPSEGQILIGGKSLDSEQNVTEIRDFFTLVFQNGALFDAMTVEENLAFPLRERGLEEEEIFHRIKNILKAIGLSEQEKKFPRSLSGGMIKRIALARAVVVRPQCILLDEPSAGLDPITAAAIIKLIQQINQDYCDTNIMVTHDVNCVFGLAKRVIFLNQGQIYWQGSVEEFASSSDGVILEYLEDAFLGFHQKMDLVKK